MKPFVRSGGVARPAANLALYVFTYIILSAYFLDVEFILVRVVIF